VTLDQKLLELLALVDHEVALDFSCRIPWNPVNDPYSSSDPFGVGEHRIRERVSTLKNFFLCHSA
jgi:hypothetical protein